MKEKLFLLLVVIGLVFPYPIISLLLNQKLLLGIVAGITVLIGVIDGFVRPLKCN